MIDDVYNAKILGFAGNIARIGRLNDPDATARAHSKLCGSTVTVDLKMDDGVVTDFAHDVKACALGQASSSIMALHVVGASAEELRAVRDMMLKMLKENGVVTDFAHDVKACALGQASSSIMASHVVGATAGELRAVRDTMLKMLKENGAPPEGRFVDLKYLEPVRDYKARHASTMLTFDAVVDAIGQIEKKRAEAAA